ncbi:hypothetical protein, partial [uncultured Roseibium sp.]|uniref:hypothetical protein n=1 Tax=uncultured Roseibium sp. TaxID=1936171 RepID=UPI002608FF64
SSIFSTKTVESQLVDITQLLLNLALRLWPLLCSRTVNGFWFFTAVIQPPRRSKDIRRRSVASRTLPKIVCSLRPSDFSIAMKAKPFF